jgi:hypothetical protein
MVGQYVGTVPIIDTVVHSPGNAFEQYQISRALNVLEEEIHVISIRKADKDEQALFFSII